MKRNIKLGICFFLYCTAMSFLFMGFQQIHEKMLQKGIAKNVIRLHVIANSDSKEDQNLKLQVRDEVISDLQDALKESDSTVDAEQKIRENLPAVESTVTDFLRKKGYHYSAEVSLCDQSFPIKTYGDLTFPAGTYRALCIRIGRAEGHNWWCVLFPSLCYVNETTAIVPETSKKRLKKKLTKEEYELLTKKPEAHSLIYDWLFR